jgi:hypothetical protein
MPGIKLVLSFLTLQAFAPLPKNRSIIKVHQHVSLVASTVGRKNSIGRNLNRVKTNARQR